MESWSTAPVPVRVTIASAGPSCLREEVGPCLTPPCPQQASLSAALLESQETERQISNIRPFCADGSYSSRGTFAAFLPCLSHNVMGGTRRQPLQVTRGKTKAQSSFQPQVTPLGSDPPARRSAADSGATQTRGCGRQRTKRPFQGARLPKRGHWVHWNWGHQFLMGVSLCATASGSPCPQGQPLYDPSQLTSHSGPQ